MFVQSERSVNSFGFTLSFGLVSLSVHPYFVRQNTELAAKVHFFLHLLSSSPENLPPFCDFTGQRIFPVGGNGQL